MEFRAEGLLVLSAYVTYYNHWRPHRSLGQAVPCGDARPLPRQACRKIAAEPVLGGLHHIYRLLHDKFLRPSPLTNILRYKAWTVVM